MNDEPNATSLPPPVLFRVGRPDLGARRDRRAVYVGNLRWRANPYAALTAKAILTDAQEFHAPWKVTRPKVTEQYALGGTLLVDSAMAIRDRVQPKGVLSAAALLADTAERNAIIVHPVELASPALMDISDGYGDISEMVINPPQTLYLVVIVRNGMIDAASIDRQSGGGDLIVTQEQAAEILHAFREENPQAEIRCDPSLKVEPTDNTEPLDVLLRRTSRGKWRPQIAGGSASLTPVSEGTGSAILRQIPKAVAAASAVWLVYLAAPALMEGRLPFMPQAQPPTPPYQPPLAAEVFAQPWPSAWINGCLLSLNNLYRPVPGYDPGLGSCGTSRTQPAAAVDVKSVMSPDGFATLSYNARPDSQAGLLMEVMGVFAEDRRVRLALPDTGQVVTAYGPLVVPPSSGKAPTNQRERRGVHALMHAQEMRAWLLDRRQSMCLDIVVGPVVDQRDSLLSPPGAPFAVAPVGGMHVTITSALSPINFREWLDSIPGMAMLSISRDFNDSNTLRANKAKAQADAKSTAIITCDHPMFPAPASWKMEAEVYAILP